MRASRNVTCAVGALLVLATTGVQAQLNPLHNFTGAPSDGSTPQEKLTLDGATLYGVTFAGGDTDAGTVFRMNIDGTGYTNLHSFMRAPDDGTHPQSPLTLQGSTLYGTTSWGGSTNGGGYGCGTLFRLSTDGTEYTVLHRFTGHVGDGTMPWGALALDGSTLYGVTAAPGGGTNAASPTIYRINTDGSAFQLVHVFTNNNPTDPSFPSSGLKLVGSTLYGETQSGGTEGGGTVFAVNTNGSGFRILHSFVDTTTGGGRPSGGLTVIGSTLYGITPSGGTHELGTLFKVNMDGTDYAVLHNFPSSEGDGTSPVELTAVGSTIYGTTALSGDGCGTLFQFDGNGTYSVLFDIYLWTSKGKPRVPNGGVTFDGQALYGVTAEGGSDNCGVIYSFTPPPSPSITATTLLPEGNVGAAYSIRLAVTNGTPPYYWLVSIDGLSTSEGLPPGLTLNATNGVLSGVPTMATTATFKVLVWDSGSHQQVAKEFSLTINGSTVPVLSIERAVQINWDSQTNNLYQVQWTPLLVTNWHNLNSPLQGTGGRMTASDATDGFDSHFYRVIVTQ